jgi:ATP-binding cassette subfamily B protein
MAMSYAVNGEVQSNITGLAGLLILIVGGAAIASGAMTLGEFVSFYVAAGLLNGAINQILAGLPDVITGNESLVTLTQLFDGHAREPYRGTRAVSSFEMLELEHVSFGYGDQEILKDACLSIDSSANIAVVGENGAGKTSLIRLILGFNYPDHGSIRANGIDYDDLSIRDLRRLIGLVPQTPTFFPGSVLENITYGIPGYSQADLEHATRLALLDDIITTLPQGLDTQIGDDGVKLSGGARQRIAITRALLGRPGLLILDEPTNHLDIDSVERLMRGLVAATNRPAIIVVSHDARVVRHAESRYRLQSGRLFLDSEPVRLAGS